MDKKENRSLGKWINVLIESFNYIVLQYLLGCVILSFQHSILFIIFFASDMYIISKYIHCVATSLDSKVWAYIFFGISIVILMILFVCVGYFPMSTTIVKVGFQMMKRRKLTKMIVAISTMALSFNLVSVSAFAAENSNATQSHVIYDAVTAESYNEELRDMGLSDTEIARLQEINLAIANAGSMREVDSLMKDFHAIVDNTPLAASISFSSTIGGTLNLDYVGDLSPISNVIYTKVVYMDNAQVEFYQRGMNDPNFVTFILDELIGKGVSVITDSVAAEIAAALGISSSAASWLVGTSIAGVLFVCQNLETWDLNDAIDNSSNGKVKLEYFYSTSASFPYYQEYENFEPWDTNRVDVPEDYEYDWQSGVYEFNR